MITYYIFRHGQTFATKYHTGYWWKIYSADILEESKIPLKKLGFYLKDIKTDINLTSEFKRCLQSSQLVSKYSNKVFIKDKRLDEFFLETPEHLKRRVVSLLFDMENKVYKRVLICTHGVVIQMIINLLSQSNKSVINPKSGELFIIKGEDIERINFN